MENESEKLRESMVKFLEFSSVIADQSGLEGDDAANHVGTALMFASLSLAMDLDHSKEFLLGYLDQHYETLAQLRKEGRF